MSHRLGRAWRSSGWRLAALLLLALAIGLLLHAVVACLLVALLVTLTHGAWRLARFSRLLAGRRRIAVADGNGIWDEIQNATRKRQRTAVDEKQRMLRLLRAFRDAAAALPDAVIALDREQRIQWFNAATVQLLGLKDEMKETLRYELWRDGVYSIAAKP